MKKKGTIRTKKNRVDRMTKKRNFVSVLANGDSIAAPSGRNGLRNGWHSVTRVSDDKQNGTQITEPIKNKTHLLVSHESEPSLRNGERSPYDGDTAIRLYLREIGQTPLITREKEVELAARIQKGDRSAREQLIKANLRLVVKIARSFEGLGLPLLDLINEGNIGLMKAVQKFDPSKGGKMSTYGAWWIKQAIKRALGNQSKTIRLPVHLYEKISKMRKAALLLHEEFGREPTDEELAEELGITASRVALLRTAAIHPASLDAPIGDDDEGSLAEIVRDENAPTPYEHLEGKTVKKMLERLLERLSDRESTILRYRFGLGGRDEETLEQVGERFGVTRERVRQIESKTLKRLRGMIGRIEESSPLVGRLGLNLNI